MPSTADDHRYRRAQETAGKVAVWLDDYEIEDDFDVLFALTEIMNGDWLAAADAIRAGKAVVAGPVSPDAAEVIVRWLNSVGARAVIDDGYYDFEEASV